VAELADAPDLGSRNGAWEGVASSCKTLEIREDQHANCNSIQRHLSRYPLQWALQFSGPNSDRFSFTIRRSFNFRQGCGLFYEMGPLAVTHRVKIEICDSTPKTPFTTPPSPTSGTMLGTDSWSLNAATPLAPVRAAGIGCECNGSTFSSHLISSIRMSYPSRRAITVDVLNA